MVDEGPGTGLLARRPRRARPRSAAPRAGRRPRRSATCAAASGSRSTTTTRATSTSSRSPRRWPDGAVKILVAIADVDALVAAGLGDRRARARQHDLGLHGRRDLPDAARRSSRRTSRRSARARTGSRSSSRWRSTTDGTSAGSERLPRGGAQPREARLRQRRRRGSRAGAIPRRRSRRGARARREQLRLQDRVAQTLRERAGTSRARSTSRRSSRARCSTTTRLADLRSEEKNRARELIEDFMIAANGVDRALPRGRAGSPSLRRVVRSPERWERIVELAAEHGRPLPAEPDARGARGVPR